MSAEAEVLYGVNKGVATITLNRPDRLNAWTPVMADQMREAFERARSDDGVRAIVLTGAGRGFCAGADMSRLTSAAAGSGDLPAPPEANEDGIEANFAQRYSYLLGIEKPIIAAINGPAAGVGMVLTFYCDLRYMAAGAKMTTAFAKRGLIAEHGAAWMLPRLIGPMNAFDLLCTARTIDADEAERLGLVRVLPAEGFRDAVHARAAELASLSSPRSVRVIKRQIYQGLFQTLAEATTLADRELALCRDTEDFREGVAHFVEKRPPKFTGR